MKAFCCKCKKPVDKIRRLQFDYEHKYLYAVECHGETQQQELRAIDMITAKDIMINAFDYSIEHKPVPMALTQRGEDE